MKAEVRVIFDDEKKHPSAIFDDTFAEVLKAIDETGTISAAAEQTRHAYSWVWLKLRNMERKSGCTFVQSLRGSKGSTLTDDAHRLLELHAKATDAAKGVWR